MSGVFIKNVSSIENEPLVAITVEYISGGEKKAERFVVFAEYCYESGIRVGEADRSILPEISDAAKLCYAVRRGETLLSYGRNSRELLVRKLRSKKIEESYARRAADILAERGYIDDREGALDESDRCLKKLWGERRILAHLASRGYRGSALDEAKLYLDDVDFVSLCAELIKKKYKNALSNDREERERAIAALIRYGYSQGAIKAAIQKCKRKYSED